MNEAPRHLHFIPTASWFITGSPPRLFATPFQFKSPREKNKNGEVTKGEGGTPRLCEALGGMIRVTTESEHTMKSQVTAHAERAKSVGMLAKIGSSLV